MTGLYADNIQSSLDVKNRVFFSPPLFFPIRLRRRAVIFLCTIKNICSGLAPEYSEDYIVLALVSTKLKRREKQSLQTFSQACTSKIKIKTGAESNCFHYFMICQNSGVIATHIEATHSGSRGSMRPKPFWQVSAVFGAYICLSQESSIQQR